MGVIEPLDGRSAQSGDYLIYQPVIYEKSSHDQSNYHWGDGGWEKQYRPNGIIESKAPILNYNCEKKPKKILPQNREKYKDEVVFQCLQISGVLDHVDVIRQPYKIFKHGTL